MDRKEIGILEAAAALFLEKGWQQTSTQDIAEACNTSKTTIYKYFASKEELGLRAAYYLSGKLLYQMNELKKQTMLSAKDRLLASIVLRMEQFHQKQAFMDVMLFSFIYEQKETYIAEINKIKYRVFRAFTELAVEALGLEQEASAWEAVLNLNGLLKEISFIQVTGGVDLDANQVADFIVDSLLAIDGARQGKAPLLSPQQIARLKCSFEDNAETLTPGFQRDQVLQSIKKQAALLEAAEREEALELVGLLEEELQKPLPKQAVIKAFLGYLQCLPGMADLCQSLRKLSLKEQATIERGITNGQ